MPSRPERLQLVREGSRDIAVGISGFGSAVNNGLDRWEALADFTGRTTFGLLYDAQEFPDLPLGLEYAAEFSVRWRVARRCARSAAEYLADWLKIWVEQGRRVLIVAFSLGGYVAIRSMRLFRHPNIEAVLILAAAGDREDYWSNIEKQGRIVSLYSEYDAALRTVYPYGVPKEETPAIGIVPVKASNVVSIDVTEIVGLNHLWASENLVDLFKLGLSHLWASTDRFFDVSSVESSPERLSPAEVARLIRWAFLDRSIWEVFSQARDGQPGAIVRARAIDRWAMSSPDRFRALLEAGHAARVAIDSGKTQTVARLSGLVGLMLDRAYSDPSS
jgi:pimeloyl-ACP methyl ester carboxylesterase